MNQRCISFHDQELATSALVHESLCISDSVYNRDGQPARPHVGSIRMRHVADQDGEGSRKLSSRLDRGTGQGTKSRAAAQAGEAVSLTPTSLTLTSFRASKTLAPVFYAALGFKLSCNGKGSHN